MQYLSGQEASGFSIICLMQSAGTNFDILSPSRSSQSSPLDLKITKHLPVGLKCANQGLRTEDPSLILLP